MEEPLLLDRYRILDVLGEGGFARVYKAYDTRLERTVAIKQIPVTKKTRHRTHREAKTTALLNHPNIVTLHEFEQTEDNFYLIMEFIEGITVDQLLKQKPPLTISETIAIASQVCIALEYAHLNGVIHRDIKPANLMLLPDGRIKVMDFGIARLVQAAQWDSPEAKDEPELLGTAAYMSPEQVKRELVDESSDIYSLGVVLYELLAGENPFRSETTRSTFFRILHGKPESLNKVNPEVSQELSDVILKAIDRNPDLRFKNAVEMRYKLERHQPVKQSPEKILKPRANRLIGGSLPEKAIAPSLSLSVKFRDFIIRHQTASQRLLLALPAAVWTWFVFDRAFGYPASFSLSIAAVAFLVTMVFPLLGVSAALLAALLPLAAHSIALSLAVLLVLVIYVPVFADPFLILLPLTAPFLGWAKIGLLYPLGVGLIDLPVPKFLKAKVIAPPWKNRLVNAVLAGFLAGLGAFLLEVADIFGQQPMLRYFIITNSFHLFQALKGSTDLIDLFNQTVQPFIQYPVLIFQILLWSVTGMTAGFLGYKGGFFEKLVATGAATAVLVFGYVSLPGWSDVAVIPVGELVQNLSFSFIILLVLLFLFSTRPALTEIAETDEEPEEEEMEDELA